MGSDVERRSILYCLQLCLSDDQWLSNYFLVTAEAVAIQACSETVR